MRGRIPWEQWYCSEWPKIRASSRLTSSLDTCTTCRLTKLLGDHNNNMLSCTSIFPPVSGISNRTGCHSLLPCGLVPSAPIFSLPPPNPLLTSPLRPPYHLTLIMNHRPSRNHIKKDAYMATTFYYHCYYCYLESVALFYKFNIKKPPQHPNTSNKRAADNPYLDSR